MKARSQREPHSRIRVAEALAPRASLTVGAPEPSEPALAWASSRLADEALLAEPLPSHAPEYC